MKTLSQIKERLTVIFAVMFKRNYVFFGYDGIKNGHPKNCIAYIGDDKDKIFLEVVSEYLKTVSNNIK